MCGLLKFGWLLIIVFLFAGGTSGADPNTANRGDLNLDGATYTIADAVMTTCFGCIVDPGPWPPLDVQEQADTDCSGEVTIGDLSRVFSVLLGEAPPYECPEGSAVTTGDRKSVHHEAAAAADAYVVEIRDRMLTATDTGWVEVVLVEAPEVVTGFQFNIEYDSDRLQLIDAELGDDLTEWLADPGLLYHETGAEPGKTLLRVVGIPCGPTHVCPSIISLPELPATLARVEFQVLTPDENFNTELNFAWTDCFDNGISVGRVDWGGCGWWPYYLAISREVYDASGNLITGLDPRYGGAGEGCLVGGTRDIPVREIDFQSGTFRYWQNCCEGNIGNPNGSGGEEPTIGDISALIDAKFITGNCDDICIPEADINGSGGTNPTCDDITIGDIAALIYCLFISGDILPCYQPCPGGI